MNKIFVPIVFCLLSAATTAQLRCYNIGGRRSLSDAEYTKHLERYYRDGYGVDIINLKVESRGDTIIYHNRLFGLPKGKNGEIFNPFSGIKKLVSKPFPLSNFKEVNNAVLEDKLILGKPTLVHFWFTRCPPCINEIPILNRLKEKYAGQVNFLAISYESREAVTLFQKTHPLNFWHITDSRASISELGISAYPTNLVVDKLGIVKFAFGSIFSESDMELVLDDLLQNP